jgi:hypothetical protein
MGFDPLSSMLLTATRHWERTMLHISSTTGHTAKSQVLALCKAAGSPFSDSPTETSCTCLTQRQAIRGRHPPVPEIVTVRVGILAHFLYPRVCAPKSSIRTLALPSSPCTPGQTERHHGPGRAGQRLPDLVQRWATAWAAHLRRRSAQRGFESRAP